LLDFSCNAPFLLGTIWKTLNREENDMADLSNYFCPSPKNARIMKLGKKETSLPAMAA
jgi:hypothetical protein